MLTVTVNPTPTRTINATITQGETYNFYGTPFTTGVSGHTYRFSNGINSCDSIVTLNLTVTAVHGCEPLIGAIYGESMVCEDSSVTLDAGSHGADSYSWTSEGDFAGERSGSRLNIAPPVGITVYTVTMTQGACLYKEEFTVEVISLPRIADIETIGFQDRRIVIDDQFGLPPYSYGVDQYPMDQYAEKYGLKFGARTFYVVDALGCKSSEISHTVVAPGLSFPPYFTPNGDGINDTWEVTGLREYYPNAKVSIFDRFGKLLVEYAGSDTGWDGTYRGNNMPSTDYWYQVDVKDINKQFVGHFSLMRR
jgi:gliding motility-associated-like protein